MTAPHIAIVPLRSFSAAKERLRPALPDTERNLLVRRMAAHVIGVVLDLMRVIVVSSDTEVLTWAQAVGADPLYQEPDLPLAPHVHRHVDELLLDANLNTAILTGAAAAAHAGVRTLAVVAGDLPFVTHEDIDVLLRLPARPGVTLAADKHGLGTNALAVAPPSAMPFRFGAESLVQHRLMAYRAGLPVRVVRRPGFELDVDTPADLAFLRGSGFTSTTTPLGSSRRTRTG